MFLEKAYAQAPTPCYSGSGGVDIADCFAPANKLTSLSQVVNIFSQNFILIAGVIFFILLVWMGFSFLRAAGSQDSKAMENVKTTLTYGIIGFVIIFSAFWIVQLINFVTGNSLGNIFSFTK